MAITLTCWLLAASELELKAHKQFLVLGADASVELTLTLPQESNKVSISSNVGEVSAPRKVDALHYVATYTPPKKNFPQLAIVFARAGERYRFLPLPLHGQETLSLETKVGADLEVTIGGKTFGPMRADAHGRVKMHVTVPPGVASGVAHSVDIAGNTKDVSVALDPPPFPRLRVVVLGEAASWSDATPLPLVAFAAETTGTPLDTAALVASANLGTVSGPVAVGHGVFTLGYRAPETVSAERATVRIKLSEEAVAEADVPLAPGPPARIDLTLDPPRVIAGEAARVAIDVRVFDAKGNAVPKARPVLSADLGTLADGRLDVPANTRGLPAATIVAALPALRQEIKLRLGGATPTRGKLTLDSALARAGGAPVGVSLVLFDRFDIPVTDAEVRVTLPPGETTPVPQATPHGYRLLHKVSTDAPTGSGILEVKSGRLLLSTPLTVLAPMRPWGVSVGLTGGASINTGKLVSFTGALALAVRPGFLPIELLFDAGGRYYLQQAQTGVAATLRGAPITLGLRYNLGLGPRFSLLFSLNGGIQPSWSTLTVGKAAVQKGFFVAPIAAAAFGVAARVGPGRLFAELGWQLVLGTGDVKGNLGGFGVKVGYLYEIR